MSPTKTHRRVSEEVAPPLETKVHADEETAHTLLALFSIRRTVRW